MSGIIRVKKVDKFVVMSKNHLNNVGISWQAKGLLSYLLGLPDDWQAKVSDLKNRSTNGRDSTSNTVKELIKAGYIVRRRVQNKKGQFTGYDYTIYEEPVNTKPDNGKPDNGKPVNRESDNGKGVTNKEPLNQAMNKLINEPTKDLKTNVEFENSNSESASTSNYNPQNEFLNNLELESSTPYGYDEGFNNEIEDAILVEDSSKQLDSKKEKKDSAQKKENAKSQAARLKEKAIDVMKRYNDLTGQKRHVVPSNTDLIVKLLKSKQKPTNEDILAVVSMKVFEWSHNPSMAAYIKPSTLFSPGNFKTYYTELKELQADPELSERFKAKIRAEKNKKANNYDNRFKSELNQEAVKKLRNMWG